MTLVRRATPSSPRSTVVERDVNIAGFRTRVLEVAGTGPRMLLLHGFADSADTWRDLLKQLGDRDLGAAAVDLPGFGRASGISRAGSMLETYDRFVTAVVDSLYGRDRVPPIIVGNSMGATIALRAAIEDNNVSAVVALAPAGLGFRRALHHASDLLDRLLPVLRVTYRLPYPRLAVQAAAASYYRARLAPGVANAWHFGSHFRGMSDFRRVGVLGRRLMAEVTAGSLDFASLTKPVTLVWGSRDPVCDVRGAAAFLDAVPDSRLVILTGSGHLPQVDDPAGVADVLAAVVDGLREHTEGQTVDPHEREG
jgi:pimeloyl-ACP methyl ester carboxylesterase